MDGYVDGNHRTGYFTKKASVTPVVLNMLCYEGDRIAIGNSLSLSMGAIVSGLG